jgi:hypothetical protein
MVGAAADAPHFLRPDRSDSVMIEVDLLGAATAQAFTEEAVLAQMRQLVDKPVRLIGDRPDRAFVSPPGGYRLADLQALEALHRGSEKSDTQSHLYVLYLSGRWFSDSDDDRTLGLTFGPSSIAIFVDQIENACRSSAGSVTDDSVRALICPLTEAATWIHEIGHVLGLVDNGTAMVNDHRDPDHGRHDSNEQCIMHWSHESGKLAAFIRKRLDAGRWDLRGVFDEACRADLAAARARSD